MSGNGQHPEGAAIVKALRHWLRREILRCLQLPDVAVSATMVTETLELPISNCDYHMSCLVKEGLLEEVYCCPVRGAWEHFYVGKVCDNEIVQVILKQTEKEDTEILHASQAKHAKRLEEKARGLAERRAAA